MVKKSKKKEQRQLAIELHKKRRMTKPALGRLVDNSFNWLKDKQLRSELVDKNKRDKNSKKSEVRRGRIECEKNGEDPVAAGYPERLEPATVEKMREEDATMVEAGDDDEIRGEEAQDEFAAHFGQKEDEKPAAPTEENNFLRPKIMLTTSAQPSNKLFNFLKELVNVVPGVTYYKRKGYQLKKIIEYAKKREFTVLLVVTEKAKKPNGIYMCTLPDGPTAFWKLSKLKLGAEMKGGATCNADDDPELILNNFATRLGRRVARQLSSMFPTTPHFRGRRTITFHNQRDFVFFRHYRYEFKKDKKTGELTGDRAALKEIGPRFTLKLRYLQHGTFDTKHGEYEFMWRPDSQVSRKKMFL